MGVTHLKKKKKLINLGVVYVIKSGNFRFWSLRLKARTEDAETTWFGNEFQRFIVRLEKCLISFVQVECRSWISRTAGVLLSNMHISRASNFQWPLLSSCSYFWPYSDCEGLTWSHADGLLGLEKCPGYPRFWVRGNPGLKP